MLRLNRALTAAATALTVLALSACSSSDDTPSSSSSSSSAEASPTASDESSAAPSESAPSESAPSESAASSSAPAPATSITGPVESAVVSTLFGDVTVDFPQDRDLKVVALGWSDAEMALALDVAPVGVYDWQGFGAETKGVGPWAAEKFGDVTPTIIDNTGDTLNFEAIRALEPDLILNTRAAHDEQVFERLSEIAPTVYAPEGTEAFATPWDLQMLQVADALGRGDEGMAIIEDVQGQISAVAEDHPDFAGRTVVAASKFGEAYGAYLAGDGRFDLLAGFGFVQNPAVAEIPVDAGFYAAVSAEQVAALNADVAVILPISFTADEVASDPLLSALPVVQEGRAIVLEETSELGAAYSAASVLSIPVVLDGLVPQLEAAVAKLG